ncbi:hypothetical protein BDP81DRAFT_79620 [Colletotrichum phormii]|uniref:Uncharacterized protein n=1 Tax=Colletotrichum phormii TaxID=359342 RepID=A0AAJ0A392_9PEZI|nr:uncharacterized protein BDP81DRAFT_79620 [Colletotrichum phormii]KAK1654217.1 hypothetical protein BDP81DRAFT_79620 [Colletotrichum phormii]
MCRPNLYCPVGPLHTSNDAYREGRSSGTCSELHVIGFAGHCPEQTSSEGIIRCCTAGKEKECAACDVRRAFAENVASRDQQPKPLWFGLPFLWASSPFLRVSRLLLAAFSILNGMSNPTVPHRARLPAPLACRQSTASMSRPVVAGSRQ